MIGPESGRVEPLIRAGALILISYACWLVLEPFVAAILFSLAIAISTWPAYQWLFARMKGRRTSSSAIACLIVAALVIAPAVMLVVSLGDAARWLLALIDEWRSSGALELPAWLARIPLVGEMLSSRLRELTSGDAHMADTLSSLAEPARRLAVAGGRALGWGVGQALFAALLLFFAYRDGDRLAAHLRHLAERLGGGRALALLTIAQSTIEGVMFSVLGAGLAQAVLATAGFAVAGIPNPYLLGALTFVSSMLPVGPPLIWIGATVYLFRADEPGWAVFMALYGFFGISSVDNIIKPFLISRSSRLPFVVTFVGVLGGVLAFGVAGVFIGPTVLALAFNIAKQSVATADPAADPEV
jgi:predicted PurR-regulated permease PerM